MEGYTKLLFINDMTEIKRIERK